MEDEAMGKARSIAGEGAGPSFSLQAADVREIDE